MKAVKYLFIVGLITISSLAGAQNTEENSDVQETQNIEETQNQAPVCTDDQCPLPDEQLKLTQAFLNPNVLGFPLNGHVSQSRFACESQLNGVWMKENYNKNSYMCSSRQYRFSATFTTDKQKNVKVIRVRFYDPKGELTFQQELQRYHKKWSTLGEKQGSDIVFNTSRWSTQFLTPRGTKKDRYVIYCYNVVFVQNL